MLTILAIISHLGITEATKFMDFCKYYRGNIKPTDSHRLNFCSLHPNLDHVVQIFNNNDS